MGDEIKVEQCDREAAAANILTRLKYEHGGEQPWMDASTMSMRMGEQDLHWEVQAFARHRIQHGAQSEWQPMETAPKDGTFVQLFEPIAHPPVSVGCYDDEAGWLIGEADFMPSKCRPRCWAPLLPHPDIASARAALEAKP